MFHEFTQFLIAHWQLSGLFVVLLLYVLFEELRDSSQKHRLDPAGCVALINHQQAMVWDLRDSASFAKGHIVSAQNVSMQSVVDHWQKLSKKQRQQPLILVCERGQTALKAANQLRAAGHSQVMLLQGGMQSWLRDSMPVITE
jgi:rhodanese-related sulfurtransferase